MATAAVGPSLQRAAAAAARAASKSRGKLPQWRNTSHRQLLEAQTSLLAAFVEVPMHSRQVTLPLEELSLVRPSCAASALLKRALRAGQRHDQRQYFVNTVDTHPDDTTGKDTVVYCHGFGSGLVRCAV